MTSLRLRSAGTRVDLTGVEELDPETFALVVEVAEPMLARPADRSPADKEVAAAAIGPRPTAAPIDPDRAAARVLGALDRALLASTRCLSIHAAAVAGPAGAAVIPGLSGAGKSTLAAASMQVGLRLISDEAACIDPSQEVLWAHPRPLGLSGHSRRLLGLAAPVSGPAETERATAPSLLGACVPTDRPVRPVLLVLAERTTAAKQSTRAEQVSRVVDASRLDGLTALLANCLNTGASGAWAPEAAWDRLTAMSSGLRVVRLRYDDPAEGGSLLAELLAEPPTEPPAGPLG